MSRKNKKALSDTACPGPVGVLRVAEWLKRNGFQEESQSARRLLKSAVPINDIEGIPHLGVEPGAYLQNKSLRPGFYIYVLKLHNIIDGKQVYSNENPELPIYNWYVGKANNPISRLRQHEVKSISINSDAQALLRSYLGELEAQLDSIEEISKKEHIEPVVLKVFQKFPNMFELDSSNIPESRPIEYGPHPKPSLQTEYSSRCGSLWTSLHGVIEMVWNKHYDESESYQNKEMEMYQEMASRYGESHVRGAAVCRLPTYGSDMREIMTSEYTVATDNSFPSNQLDADASEIMKYIENARHSDEEVVGNFRSHSWKLDPLIRDIYQRYKSMPALNRQVSDADVEHSDAKPKRRTRSEERRFKANKKFLKEKQEALSEGLFQEYEEHLGVRYHTHYETGLRMGIKAITPKSDFLNTRIIKELESGGDNPFPSPLGDKLWGKILDYYRNFAGQSGQLRQLELGVSEYIYLTFLSSRSLPKSVKIVGIKEAFKGMSRKRSHLPKYIELLPDGRLAPKSSILEQINIDLSSPDGLLGSILPKLPHGNRASAKRTFDRMKSIARNPNADLEMFAEAIAKFIKSLSSGLSLHDGRRATDTTNDETRGAVEAIRESTNSLVRQERLDGLLTTAKGSPPGSRSPSLASSNWRNKNVLES